MNKQFGAEQLCRQASEIGVVATMAANFRMPVRVEMGISANTCQKDIDDLDLSVRSQNCLKRAGVMKVHQLISMADSDELMKLRNLGKKSLQEIKTTLLAIGYEQLDEYGKLIFWKRTLELNCD